MSRFLLDLPPDQYHEALPDQPSFRAKQLLQWVHQKRVSSFELMTNLAKPLRQQLESRYHLRSLTEEKHLVSSDRLTEKWLFSTSASTDESIETVLIRELKGSRRTVCVSSMIGCQFGCAFCATGKGGYQRDLTCGEIVEQIYRVEESARASEEERGISNVVFMGMGEPLMNYDAVLAAVGILVSPDGMNLSRRHIAISTVGVVPGIHRLADEAPGLCLSISLHAAEQRLREQLIPAAGKWRLPELLQAMHYYAGKSSREITVEYCLIRNVNDRVRHAKQLLELLKGLPCRVNLIPLNPVAGFAGEAPSPEEIGNFQQILTRAGTTTTLRTEKGGEISAACGQLRGKYEEDRP